MRLPERILRGLWRKLLTVRFLREKRGGEIPVVEQVAGRTLLVLPSVFNPRLLRSGAFLAEHLDPRLVPEGSRVLDLGTGTGIGALVASDWARQVVAVDINPEAVRATRINALLNRCEHRIDVREGDLFEPVGDERFDVVLFNPPYYHGEPRDERDRAWRGTDLDRRFVDGLANHLEPGGHAILCLSTDGDVPFVEALEERGFRIEVVSERDLLNEILRLYRAFTSSV